MNRVDRLYEQARSQSARHPIWEQLRAAQANDMPRCAEHPDRVAYGGYGRPQCLECIERTMKERQR